MEISAIAGVLRSLLFSYVPGFKNWHAGLTSDNKRLTMLLFLIVATVGIYLIDNGFTWQKGAALELASAFLAALVANQGAYSLTPRGEPETEVIGG